MSGVIGGGRKATEDFFLQKDRGTGSRTTAFGVREGTNDFRVRLDPTLTRRREAERKLTQGLLPRIDRAFDSSQSALEAFSSPLRRNLETARARNERAFERRDISGSSIAQGFLRGQARQDETEISQFESRLKLNLEQLDIESRRAVINDLNRMTENEIQTDLVALGLSSGAAQIAAQGGPSKTSQTISDVATIASGISGFF